MENNLYDQLLNAANILIYEQKCEENIAKLDRKKNEELKTKLNSYDQKVRKSVGSIKGLLVPGVIALACGVLFLFLGILMSAILAAEDEDAASSMGVLIAWGIIFLIAGIVLLVLAFNKKKRNSILRENAVTEYNHYKNVVMIEEALQCDMQIQELKKEIDDLKFDKLQATEFLPIAYADAYSVSFMLVLVENGRCDTLKEAINTLELERRHHQLLNALQVINLKLDYINRALVLVQGNMERLNTNVNKIKEIEKVEFLIN